jgi:hypothetical protein
MSIGITGFYKLEEDSAFMLHAPNFVSGPGFELLAEREADRLAGADGWRWFESRAAAEAALVQTK